MITVSCDDMTKLNVGGGMMVSRYHQINQIFMIDDSPDYEDHDFNLPGYKVCISAYMSLEFNDYKSQWRLLSMIHLPKLIST